MMAFTKASMGLPPPGTVGSFGGWNAQCAFQSFAGAVVVVLAGKKAPAFTLKDVKGNSVSLESYRGKVVVLNFWTKTCGPCMEEMPEIADLARILKEQKDVAVVTVSTDDTAQEAVDTPSRAAGLALLSVAGVTVATSVGLATYPTRAPVPVKLPAATRTE